MPRQRAAPDLIDEESSFGRGVLAALGRAVTAHPSLAGGSVAFTVIFGFVAANALWAQPGQHPAPFLKTRETAASARPVMPAEPASRSPHADGAPTRPVTTYRIEHSDDTQTASIPVPNVAPARVPVAVEKAPGQPLVSADLVLIRIQDILARKGLYGGEIDGLMGPKSAAAIRAWEKANGYVETGKATPGLLAVMETPTAPAKPVDVVGIEKTARPAQKPRPMPAVAADQRAGEPVTVRAADTAAGSDLVRQIQSGLSNIAYAEIAVDGVAGAETTRAISAFEKHYRLPVTGQPNETVLKKLLEIGAL